MKGITPVIAIIVLLLITVALAGAAWNYLYQYWITVVGKTMQIMDTYCVAGNEAIILIRNTGTQEVDVTAGGDVTVINTSSGLDPGGYWYDLNTNMPLVEVNPGQVVRYNVSCSSFCLFRFIVGGRTMQASVQC
jgi:flagellin-like protein